MEVSIQPAKVGVKPKSLEYSDVVGVNVRSDRSGMLREQMSQDEMSRHVIRKSECVG